MSDETKKSGKEGDGSSGSIVIDFNEVRNKRLEEKKRKTERIFFQSLLSVYAVENRTKFHPVEIMDVSEEGCSFQIPLDTKQMWPRNSDDVSLRPLF